MRVILLALIILFGGCSGRVHRDILREDVVITASADGWNLKPGRNNSTIVIFPDGSKQNVGTTQYPDAVKTYLYKIDGSQPKQQCLVLYMPPLASGGALMTVFEIQDDRLGRLYDIQHRYEFVCIPHQTSNPRVGIVDLPDGIQLKRIIFPGNSDQLVANLREVFEWPYGESKVAR